ncbi:molybdopterin-dependent oxidoreductase [Pedobacter rhodius]|uniref:Molybdopterin-dependent oxidoreductase n=1 Tax=Pedobacter rhodius TaxID=3004098 RepID=A0ABT4L1Q8_9SPHI|nr:molybdopterin-dependent oxidoreductase [Pedobacter sp. SJ11]MCZ4225112.1 molybdopterin-dependent oxidoreductase [Pedobacter sp. SJ11]
MKKCTCAAIAFLFLTVGLTTFAAAQVEAEAVVKVGGVLTGPRSITVADLQNLERVQVSRKDKDNKKHQYTGVSLSALLVQCGATTGKDLRGKNLTKYVIAEASDGYQVIFSLAELDPEFSDDKIILADTIDNAPLAPADGPFRIIVQKDKRPARCIKQVRSIRIEFAK